MTRKGTNLPSFVTLNFFQGLWPVAPKLKHVAVLPPDYDRYPSPQGPLILEDANATRALVALCKTDCYIAVQGDSRCK